MILRLAFLVLFTTGGLVSCKKGAVPHDFFDKLLNGYDSKQHPFTSNNQQLQINFVFFIYHIAVPRTGDPRIKYNGFVKLDWIDPRIEWNAADQNGVNVAVLPSNYSIWIPPLIQIGPQGQPRRKISPRPRTSLHLFNKDIIQKAWISHTVQIEGEIGCEIISSFPHNSLECSTTWHSRGTLEEEIFRLRSKNIFLKNLYMADYEIPKMNGWRILKATQERMLIKQNPENFTFDRKSYNRFLTYIPRSGIVCRFIIQSDDFTLALLTDLPQIVLAILICFSWFIPPKITVGLSVAFAYILSIFEDDLYHRIPEYELIDFHTMDKLRSSFAVSLPLARWVFLTKWFPGLPMLFLWNWNALTGVWHLFMEYEPEKSWELCRLYCRPYFRSWHWFLKLESWLSNDKQRADDLHLELHLVRVGISLFLFFSFLLFVIFC